MIVMEVIINAFERSELSRHNGYTYPVIGHKDGLLMVDILDEAVLIPLNECLIVDIQTHLIHAFMRVGILGFDYWFDILQRYLKVNKISAHRKELPKLKEVTLIHTTFEEQKDNDIFNPSI